jgi:hypothetical protein
MGVGVLEAHLMQYSGLAKKEDHWWWICTDFNPVILALHCLFFFWVLNCGSSRISLRAKIKTHKSLNRNMPYFFCGGICLFSGVGLFFLIWQWVMQLHLKHLATVLYLNHITFFSLSLCSYIVLKIVEIVVLH